MADVVIVDQDNQVNVASVDQQPQFQVTVEAPATNLNDSIPAFPPMPKYNPDQTILV